MTLYVSIIRPFHRTFLKLNVVMQDQKKTIMNKMCGIEKKVLYTTDTFRYGWASSKAEGRKGNRKKIHTRIAGFKPTMTDWTRWRVKDTSPVIQQTTRIKFGACIVCTPIANPLPNPSMIEPGPWGYMRKDMNPLPPKHCTCLPAWRNSLLRDRFSRTAPFTLLVPANWKIIFPGRTYNAGPESPYDPRKSFEQVKSIHASHGSDVEMR